MALFVKVQNDGIFGVSAGTTAQMVHCTLTDEVAGINQSILTSVSITYNETVQFFQSFDDLIHYFYFGQGLGSIHFEVMCFTDCNSSSAPGLDTIITSIGRNRGQKVTLSMGRTLVTGILMDFTVTLTVEPMPIYNVSINLGMIDNGLQKPNISSAC